MAEFHAERMGPAVEPSGDEAPTDPALARQRLQIRVMNRFRGIFQKATLAQLQDIDAWLNELDALIDPVRESVAEEGVVFSLK